MIETIAIDPGFQTVDLRIVQTAAVDPGLNTAAYQVETLQIRDLNTEAK